MRSIEGPEVDPQLSLWNAVGERIKRHRKPDELWEAWVATWGEPSTRDERARLNAALRQLREIAATPEQISRALRAYDREFPGIVRSAQGVTGNWTMLTTSMNRKLASPACPECGLRRGHHDSECSQR